MLELISIKQDEQGTRYFLAGSFSIFNESWLNETSDNNEMEIDKQIKNN